MAVAYQSIGSFNSGTTTVSLTHPSGLAEGDLMIGCLTGLAAFGATPTGWTKLQEIELGDSSGFYMASYYKEASAGDVSAGSTTFNGGSGFAVGGVILRITGHDTSNIVSNSALYSPGTTATPTVAAGVTPATVNSLMVMFWSALKGEPLTFSASGQAVATNDPTWTERLDYFWTVSTDDFNLNIATASRPEETATGDCSITYTTANGNSIFPSCILMSVGLPNDVTVSVDPLVVSGVLPNATAIADANVTVTPLTASSTLPDITVTAQENTVWTLESKPSDSIWANEDLIQ